MKRLKITVGVLITSLSVIGCSGFLDETPDNRTKIDSPEKVGEVVTLAYPKGTFIEFADVMSDNAVDSEKISVENVSNTEAFFWEDIRSESQDSPTYYWNACYKAIAQANTAIEAADKMEAELQSKGRTAELQKIWGYKGEALVARAYAHFMLVNLWAKTYNPATASSDMGIPYTRTVETTLLPAYERNSVQEVYDFIEEDLLEGLDLIEYLERSPATEKFHFGVESAKAFAARFFIYKGNFDKALEYSENIPTNGSSLRDYNYYASLGDEEVQALYADPSETTNLLVSSVMSGKAYTGGGRYNFRRAAAQAFLFSATSNPFGKGWNYGELAYTTSEQFLGIVKFVRSFEVTDPTNQTGFRYTNVVLFSNDMLYLDRIEALISTNQLSEALTLLDVFTRKRTAAATSNDILTEAKLLEVGTSTIIAPFYESELSEKQKAYLGYLADLRRRESYLEGIRWFDVRRYNMELVHRNTYNSSREETLTQDDNRRQLQIPQMAISNGIPANPR